MEKILVTADEVHDAVKSVPREGEAIRHLDSVVVGDSNGRDSTTQKSGEDTKAEVVKIEMSQNAVSKSSDDDSTTTKTADI